MFTILEIFEMAIRIEENGEAYYREAAEYAKSCGMSEKVSALWEQLAEEEREHRKMFLEMKRSILQQSDTDIRDRIGSWYIVEAIGNRLFSFDPACARNVSEPEDIIEMARTVEEDSITFYEFLMQLVDTETVRSLITRIIEEERRHVERLNELIDV